MFTHCTHRTVYKSISTSCCYCQHCLWYGLGINCSDICQVIHEGVPQDLEAYLQESGHAGCDGKHSIAMIIKKGNEINRRYTSS